MNKREFKFRAWAPPYKNIPGEMLDHEAIFAGGDAEAIFAGETECVVMQATGIEDPNGVEIFEGDVLELGIEGNRCVVEYHAPEFTRRYPAPTEWDGVTAHGLERSVINIGWCVIGNIYESPDLLRSKSRRRKAK